MQLLSAHGLTLASLDAIALARPDKGPQDTAPLRQMAPHAPDQQFDLDERGLVLATPEGTVSPQGVRVIAGTPPVVPPLRPGGAAALSQNAETVAVLARMSAVPPRPRPGGLIEGYERAQNSGMSLAELGAIRPVARKITEKEEAERNTSATAQAIDTSPLPVTRPRDIARMVEAARSTEQQAEEEQAEPEVTQVAAAVPRNAQPSLPSSANVAKQATVRNALNLSRLNLIGVYGKPSSRRALVRLPSGRYQKVAVGDRLDGGRVAAIGETELVYSKGGRTVTLKLP